MAGEAAGNSLSSYRQQTIACEAAVCVGETQKYIAEAGVSTPALLVMLCSKG